MPQWDPGRLPGQTGHPGSRLFRSFPRCTRHCQIPTGRCSCHPEGLVPWHGLFLPRRSARWCGVGQSGVFRNGSWPSLYRLTTSTWTHGALPLVGPDTFRWTLTGHICSFVGRSPGPSWPFRSGTCPMSQSVCLGGPGTPRSSGIVNIAPCFFLTLQICPYPWACPESSGSWPLPPARPHFHLSGHTWLPWGPSPAQAAGKGEAGLGGAPGKLPVIPGNNGPQSWVHKVWWRRPRIWARKLASSKPGQGLLKR